LWCKGINLESKVSPPAKYFTAFALENSTAGERKGEKKSLAEYLEWLQIQ